MPQSRPPEPNRRRLLPWAVSLGAALLVGGVALAAVAHASGTDSGPDVGAEPYDFELPVVFGPAPSFRLSEHRGVPVVVEVFAGWCDYCRRSTPVLADAAVAPRDRPVRFIGVSVDDSPRQAADTVQRWGIPYAVAWDDGRVAWTWSITALPTVVVIDASGRVRHVGAGRPESAELEGWLSDVGAARLD